MLTGKEARAKKRSKQRDSSGTGEVSRWVVAGVLACGCNYYRRIGRSSRVSLGRNCLLHVVGDKCCRRSDPTRDMLWRGTRLTYAVSAGLHWVDGGW